ncbi:hypothetical protein J6590_020699 [Homalodisca vitripennis]|nr:hypothetical protein J6590_020699 [Homalodisca vitripennis]
MVNIQCNKKCLNLNNLNDWEVEGFSDSSNLSKSERTQSNCRLWDFGAVEHDQVENWKYPSVQSINPAIFDYVGKDAVPALFDMPSSNNTEHVRRQEGYNHTDDP